MSGRAVLVCCIFSLVGCRTTPDEIERIRLHNELLREEIRIVKNNCSYYRDLEIELEDDGGSVERPVEHAPDARLEKPADGAEADAIDLAPVLEDEVRRQRPGVEALTDLSLPVHVHLDEPHAPFELGGEPLDDRQLPDTGASPVGVEIDQRDALAGGHAGEGDLAIELLEAGRFGVGRHRDEQGDDDERHADGRGDHDGSARKISKLCVARKSKLASDR